MPETLPARSSYLTYTVLVVPALPLDSLPYPLSRASSFGPSRPLYGFTVNLHALLAASPLPAGSFAPVVTVAV